VLSGRTILVADDDRDTRVILRTVLERYQFIVVEAATADDAFAASLQQALDLVILNYPMPSADGRTLVHHLRSHTMTRNVPILNLTSRVVPQFLQEAAKEGVNRTVSKPVDVEALIRIVSDMVEPATVNLGVSEL
jgi:CheY-like chemotaxis protein